MQGCSSPWLLRLVPAPQSYGRLRCCRRPWLKTIKQRSRASASCPWSWPGPSGGCGCRVGHARCA
eukprot:2855805-Alexandrium_andersonii.AAC.1